ncbi:putative speedy protein-like protein 3 isoform X2 [Aotus nancymaae]|uniref:putative speedy protein-like protein 3 isoform X2 n=1 Tax=Aotus nancymaae TaxID=37293 RepID=UPI0030FDF895
MVAWFLYSDPWVDPSPPFRFLCSKRKREWLDESEELDEEPEKVHTPESEETWVVETLCGLKVKPKKRQVSAVLPEHHKVFNRLLDHNPPLRFLCWKRKREWSDESEEEPEKVLAPESEDTWVVETLCGLKVKLKRHYLANDMEEDDKAPKQAIFYFLCGKNCSSDPCSRSFGSSSSVPCTGELGFPQRSWRRSKLMTQRTGCGLETAPSFPRAPGTMEA